MTCVVMGSFNVMRRRGASSGPHQSSVRASSEHDGNTIPDGIGLFRRLADKFLRFGIVSQ